MKKVKYAIAFLSIAIMMVIIIIISINNKKVKNTENLFTDSEYNEENENYVQLDDIDKYLKIKKCINIYINYLNTDSPECYGYDEYGNYINLASDEYINSNIMNLLSNEYINNNSINVSNLKNYIYKIEDNCFFIPIEIIYKGNTEDVKSFGVYGLIETQEYQPVMECYLIINIDEYNMTFSIEQLKSKEEIYNINTNIPNEIEEKDNNIFSATGITQEDLIHEYINDFKRLAFGYPDILYNNYLNEDYRNEKFENREKFKKYILENKDEIQSINPVKYQIENHGEYTQYYAIDQNGRTYIFDVVTPTNYRIILDTYTIDLPEFIEKYNNATEQQKVALNIDKFMQAVNSKDYKYAYGCLADSFKNNYFKTQEDFENYLKENFYKNSTVEYKNFDTQGDIYTYTVTLTNKDGEGKIDKTFIMKLGEERNFVLSFNR